MEYVPLWIGSWMMTILLVDDHAMFADCLALVLGGKHKIKAVASASDALTELSASPPALVLLDYNLPDIDGVTLAKIIRALPNPPPVLLFSGDTNECLVTAARQAGASGFLHKSLPAEALMDALERVQAGETVWPETIDASDSGDPKTLNGNTNWDHHIVRQLGITDRQFEVLQLMTNGLSNKAIARELYIAESTVKTHVKSLFHILNANNRTACFNKARDLGLVRD